MEEMTSKEKRSEELSPKKETKSYIALGLVPLLLAKVKGPIEPRSQVPISSFSLSRAVFYGSF